MIDVSNDDRKQVLDEVLMDELKAIREYLEDVPAIRRDVQELKQDVAELKVNMKVVKAAVIDQSRQMQDFERRLTAVETDS